MQLDISDVLREIGRRLEYVIDEPPMVDADVECTRPITGRVEFANTGGLLLVRGNAETGMALPCSRCAIYFERKATLRFDEQFELKRSVAGPRSLQTVTVVEEDESPIANKLFDGNVFDLTELLRQYILLNQPTQPLPPEGADGKCKECHRTAAEVLAQAGLEDVRLGVNPALARLGELIAHDPAE